MCKYTPLKNLCIANHTIIKKIFGADKISKKSYAELVMQNKKMNFNTLGKIVSKPRVDKPKKPTVFK